MRIIFDKNVHSALTCSASVTTAMTSSKPALAMTVVDSRLQKKICEIATGHENHVKALHFFMFFLQLFEIGSSAHVGRLSIFGQRCSSQDFDCHDDNHLSQDI
jgi:hypothetical protein